MSLLKSAPIRALWILILLSETDELKCVTKIVWVSDIRDWDCYDLYYL